MIAFLLSAALSANPSGSAISPVAVQQMISRFSPRRTVNKLANAFGSANTRTDLGNYDKVLDGIASGNGRWLALVPKIEGGTDAATAEALRIAVATALPKNPTAILRLITLEQSWRDACSYPMIEPTNQEARAYFKIAIPAVIAVRNRALDRAKHMCLRDLVRAEKTP